MSDSNLKVLVTGSQGFVGSFICQDLLANGFHVVGIDNYSKYGHIHRPQDSHPNFTLIQDDICNLYRLGPLDYVVANAAFVGGVEYFHKVPFDLMNLNEKIASKTFELIINHNNRFSPIKRLIIPSSSMVYENSPTHESATERFPPPTTSYAFQKLALEYWCKSAYQQHKIPYTILRLFNVVGIGEDKAIAHTEALTLSHVLPDFVLKALKQENPFNIYGSGQQLRCFTNGKDVARAVRLSMLSPAAENETFNVATAEVTKIIDLAKIVWNKINPGKEIQIEFLPKFEYDTITSVADTRKAKDVLGFTADISLDKSIDEVIEYMK